MLPLFAAVIGDLWNWLAGVFGRIGDVSIYWLLLALALKTAESAFIGLSWREHPPCGVPGRPAVVQDRLGRLTGRNGD